MKENKTTVLFIAAAAACIALALITAPVKRDPASKGSRMGQPLFETFDPRQATGIEIVEMDEEKLEAKSIEVAKTEQGWFLRRPGKPDYPANADNQLKDVSTILFDVRILDQAGEGAGEHAKFGVLDPSRAQPGDTGVGRMIALKNNSGSNLAQLIIGNEVDGLMNTHFVRKPDENEVYRVEMQNVNNVSTKFVNWVEKDFLDLDKLKIKQVTFDNYEVKDGKIVPSAKQILNYDSSEWKLLGSLLTPDEELDKAKLDGMRDAFDDLEIIDVEKKPQVLASSLKNGNEFVAANNVQELKNSAKSLFGKGFLTVEMVDKAGKPLKYENGKPKLQVVSKKGEIIVGMKDGVEYVLRFGDSYRGTEEEDNATGDSRYIYAYARVNPGLLEQPVLQAVPPPLAAPQKKKNPTPQKKDSQKGAKGPEGDKGKQSPPPLSPPGPPPNFTPPSPPPSKAPSNLPKEVLNASNAKPAIIQSDKNASPSDEFTKKSADRAAEIARIKAANSTKQKEFNQKLATAQKRAKELNENLADWYYVISNDVYEKIRLNRNDFVKAKEKEEEAKPEEISASHILISYKGANRADSKIKRSKNEAQKEAQRIHNLITQEGKDFAAMAKEHSDGPSSSKGGDLGKFKFEVMAKPFSEAAFALDVDSVSEVVETDFGFHVIKRTQ